MSVRYDSEVEAVNLHYEIRYPDGDVIPSETTNLCLATSTWRPPGRIMECHFPRSCEMLRVVEMHGVLRARQ